MRIRVSASRLELLSNGRVRLALKTTWRNGVTHVTMPQADLILRMCAQIPLPRRPSLRYHGVFAPAARLRSKIVPAGDRARCRRKNLAEGCKRETSTRLAWSEALKRAFREDILQCQCGSRRVVLAAVIARAECERIVRHLAVANPEDFVAIRGPPTEFEFVDVGPEPWDLPDDDPGDELAA